jgi:hypothetical protein
MTSATALRCPALGPLVLLIALAAFLALLLHGPAPFGAPPPTPQAGSGVMPVLAPALRAAVRRPQRGWRSAPALG